MVRVAAPFAIPFIEHRSLYAPKTELLEEKSEMSSTENESGCTETDNFLALLEIEILCGTFAEIFGSASIFSAVRCKAAVLPDSFSTPKKSVSFEEANILSGISINQPWASVWIPNSAVNRGASF